MYSRDGEFRSEVCIVGLCRRGEDALSARSGVVATLSSGPCHPVFFVLSWAWGCLFPLAGVGLFGLFGLLGVCFVLKVMVHEGFVT